MPMAKKPIAQVIDIAKADLRAAGGTAPPIVRAARVLASGGVAVLRFSPVPRETRQATSLARSAAKRIIDTLVDGYALPPEVSVELDEESWGTPVAPFREDRFLLPHQDGGHRSFLTPSALDIAAVTADLRTFSDDVYWKRASHKMYQGFLVTNTGRVPGATYYYDVFSLLWDAFAHRYGRQPHGLVEFAQFELRNVALSKGLRPQHQSRYLTFGALLGATDPALHVLPSGPRAESELWPGQYARLPRLCEMVDGCPCGGCHKPGTRLLCNTCMVTLGRTWPQVRQLYEGTVIGQRYDLLLANNLTLLHAAQSDTTRTVLPVCLVTERAEGDAYERWLSAQWHNWYGHAEQAEAQLGQRAAAEAHTI
jgi:hypothetical protein